ncbi:MAG: iron chelate uptake ABC transporter family permease subunit [Planctomycetes bacterium]|nr:iron chelate uptake ABC transporter family permease subunit [Planctomycetota bacterium]
MIRGFLDAWPLFGDSWLSLWLIALQLAAVGVFLVVRDRIFVGAAVAQSATFGIAVALCLGSEWSADGSFWRGDRFLALVAGAFAVGASLLIARGGGRTAGRRGAGSEAVAGFVFLAGSSGALLVIAHSPHGVDDVERLFAASGLGAAATDVALFGALAVLTLGLVVWRRRQLLLLALDPVTAAALGVDRRLELLLAAWLGLLLGQSMRLSGLLYAFGCLVLPGLIARAACPALLPMVIVAPLVGVAASVGGALVGQAGDFNQAPATVGLLCVVLAATWGVRALRRR